jgi:uncharacterized protein
MNPLKNALYFGDVVHQRFRPLGHRLKYRVASVLIDVDTLATASMPGLFSYNRFNIFSVHDRDHGDGLVSISDFAWNLVRDIDEQKVVTRIMMLSYPRMLGYGFNPLTVFYGLDADGDVRALLYEVHNTFGGRHVYSAGPYGKGEAPFAKADKVFRVSPFNGVEGHYGLRTQISAESAALGVTLTTAEGPILKAYFQGEARTFTTASFMRLFLTLPLMTLKIMAGIHWEALKLWLKGLKLHPIPDKKGLKNGS